MMTDAQRERYLDLIPRVDPERNALVMQLSRLAVELDDEAGKRPPMNGTWNDMVAAEIRRAAGAIRLVATFVMQGSLSEGAGTFWVHATKDYLRLIRSADRSGVIR